MRSVSNLSDFSTLEGSLEEFKFLRVLNLSNNRLQGLDDCIEQLCRFQYLEHLGKYHMPCVLQLYQLRLELHGNPIAEESDYRLRVIARIPWLHVFDRHIVTTEEKAEATKK